MSPARRPAFWAGESGTTDWTTKSVSTCDIRAPIPVIEPDSDWCEAATSAGVRNRVWPVSPTASTRPWVAP